MRVLITGADGSLGSALMLAAEQRFYQPFGMSRKVFQKRSIEKFLRDTDATRLDAAILNDGTNHLSWIGSTEKHDEEIIQRNVMAPYWALNALVAQRTVHNPMRIIFVTSQTYRVPQRTTSLYCASKAAATMLMRVAARELAPYGWVINAVAPGKIEDTRMSDLTDEQVCDLRGWSKHEADGYAKKLIPAGRFTNTEEISDIIFNTLEMPSYVNGTVIEAFGGV
jgi:NAD(P)-dependent dehydrogenase (short-subunit alcohol dehydrogenase family)